MDKITKTVLGKYISRAINANKVSGMDNFGLFNLNIGKTTIQFKYVANMGGRHMFSIIDFSDPYDGQPHGYPKVWDGDIFAFHKEFIRECEYINDIHSDNESDNDKVKFIKVEQ